MTALAEQLAAGVAALRQQRWSDAEAQLRPVYQDAELAAAADLSDVRARVCSLYAQAALEAGALDEADAACRQALRLLRLLRDKAGLDEVRALQDRVVAALVERREQEARLAEQRRVAETPTDELLAEATTPEQRMELLVKRADALGAVQRAAEGVALASEALDLATRHADTRWTVLAHLSLLRLRPSHAQQHLWAAHACAEAASEFNLVSMVARAAELSGTALPVQRGPHADPPEGAR
jgi:hypothetical protein